MTKEEIRNLTDKLLIYLCKQNIDLDNYSLVQHALDEFVNYYPEYKDLELVINEKGEIYSV